jgi:protein-tyrosine phosphatase
VDVHSHILPGVDDGAKTLEESVAMLRLAVEGGTTDIVASPHANHEFKFEPDIVAAKLEEMRRAINGAIRIHTGCDFHLSYDNIQDSLLHPTKYTINHKNYVLVEFSDLLIPKTTEDVFYQMQAAGMTPIITHPERNMLLHKRLEGLAAWVESGCLLQVTAGSFLGRFGKQAKAFADRLLQQGLVHIVASDAHDTKYRPPSLREAYAYVSKACGPGRAEMLFVKNPTATLTGAPLETYYPETASLRKWYQFWS